MSGFVFITTGAMRQKGQDGSKSDLPGSGELVGSAGHDEVRGSGRQASGSPIVKRAKTKRPRTRRGN